MITYSIDERITYDGNLGFYFKGRTPTQKFGSTRFYVIEEKVGLCPFGMDTYHITKTIKGVRTRTGRVRGKRMQIQIVY